MTKISVYRIGESLALSERWRYRRASARRTW